jgi:hypothetical protein
MCFQNDHHSLPERNDTDDERELDLLPVRLCTTKQPFGCLADWLRVLMEEGRQS